MNKTTTLLLTASMLSTLNATPIEDKVDALIEEVEALKVAKTSNLDSYYGAGSAFSKAYTSSEKLSIGGYGHTDYTNYTDASATTGKDDTIDNYRAILYVGYKFSDKVIFNSEIEFEHVKEEIAVEFAAIDLLQNEYYNFRLGHFIVPVGNVNLRHEPTLFNAVNRPETERYIIPATWHENGAMVYGTLTEGLEYQVATVASLNANSGTSIRKMRQEGSKSVTNDFGYAGRLTYRPINGLEITASGFYGQTDQNRTETTTTQAAIAEAHILYNVGGFELTALYARTSQFGRTGTNSTAGYYANIAYKIGQLTPFYRNESYNINSTTLFASNARTINTFGLNYFPHEQVVIKVDYNLYDNEGTAKDNLAIGIGYIF